MFKRQVLPVLLTFVVFAVLVGIYFIEIVFLNNFTRDQISTTLRWQDILIGMTIYLKTSIDFGIFIGNLMHSHPSWKSRIAIEIGTALGNALGTIVILLIWDFFKEIPLLLFFMIFLASMVLIRLAKDGIEHAVVEEGRARDAFARIVAATSKLIDILNNLVQPVLSRVMPNVGMTFPKSLNWKQLFILSFTVPFILGLDDFAGYVPLFNIVNVFGFGVGVFLGHMVLNMLLFISPDRTIKVVKNPVISYLGALAFVGLAVWGFYEAFHLLFEAYVH
jgi:hypothetical protein